MKILHITPSYKPAYIYAGPVESVARLCEGLAEAGHEVHVYTTTANGDIELDVPAGAEQNVSGVKVTYFKRVTKDPTNMSPDLWRQLMTCGQEFDAVHIHSWWNFCVLVAAWICHFKRIRIIVSPRGMLSEYIFRSTNPNKKRWLHTLLGRRALAKAVFHATASAEYEECVKLIPGWKGFLLPNILLLPEINIRKEPNEVFTLIYLSRIHPKKGLELLLESMTNLPFDVQLKIAGSGDDRYVESLKKLIDKLKLTQKVRWLGWKSREEKFVELMNSDSFVLTSYNENFANVVIEALHVGTPVLISEEVGLSPFVSENNLGWVTALNVESIHNTIIQAYQDTERRLSVNQQGRSVINEAFSQTHLIAKYVEHYNLVNTG